MIVCLFVMESTLPHQQPAPAAAHDVDLLTADDYIQEVEPVPVALTKDELKATAQEYAMVDNRCWVWKHVGLLKTLTFSASQELYSHVCLRCLGKNQSLVFSNCCLIAVLRCHFAYEEAQGTVGSGACWHHCGIYSELSSSSWAFRAAEPEAGIIVWLVNY